MTTPFLTRRADQLVQEDNDSAVPYCVATGNTKQVSHENCTHFAGIKACLVSCAQTLSERFLTKLITLNFYDVTFAILKKEDFVTL